MGWTYTDPLTQLTFAISQNIQRIFITADPILQTHYTMQNAKTFAGDFEFECDLLISALPALAEGLISKAADLNAFVAILSSGGVRFSVAGAQVDFTNNLISINKLTRVKFSRVGTTGTVTISGLSQSLTVNGSSFVVDSLMALPSISRFTAGIMADPTLTDLATPSNSESWKLDQPFPVTTEQSSSGSNLLTYVNADSVTRELFTFIDDNWSGAELVVNGGFDADTDWGKGAGWSISGGTASYDGTGGTSSIGQSIGVQDGLVYRVTLNVIANTGTGTNPIDIGATRYNNLHLNTGFHTFTDAQGVGTSILLFGRASEPYEIDNISVKRILEVA